MFSSQTPVMVSAIPSPPDLHRACGHIPAHGGLAALGRALFTLTLRLYSGVGTCTRINLHSGGRSLAVRSREYALVLV